MLSRASSKPRCRKRLSLRLPHRIPPQMKYPRTCMPENSRQPSAISRQEEQAGARELTFAQAIREALAEEMRRDSTVCIMGEDVAEAGTPFKVLSGLLEEFGKERVLDTPKIGRA